MLPANKSNVNTCHIYYRHGSHRRILRTWYHGSQLGITSKNTTKIIKESLSRLSEQCRYKTSSNFKRHYRDLRIPQSTSPPIFECPSTTPLRFAQFLSEIYNNSPLEWINITLMLFYKWEWIDNRVMWFRIFSRVIMAISFKLKINWVIFV